MTLYEFMCDLVHEYSLTETEVLQILEVFKEVTKNDKVDKIGA